MTTAKNKLSTYGMHHTPSYLISDDGADKAGVIADVVVGDVLGKREYI